MARMTRREAAGGAVDESMRAVAMRELEAAQKADVRVIKVEIRDGLEKREVAADVVAVVVTTTAGRFEITVDNNGFTSLRTETGVLVLMPQAANSVKLEIEKW